MKDMKLKPIVITFVIVVLLLAAVSLGYQYIAKQKPLEQQLASLKYSQITSPIKKQDGVYHLTLQVEQDNQLQHAISELTEIMDEHELNNSQYVLQLASDSDSNDQKKELQTIWREQLFAVAEIMANGNYSELPELMNTIEQQYEGVEAVTEIDEQYVYITLHKDGQRFDKMLPLEGGKMEVWQNAKL